MQDLSNKCICIKRKLAEYNHSGCKLFATSSFQTQSVVLLHIISNLNFHLPVFFINTGFHFPETLIFKEQLTKLLRLDVRDIWPFIPKSEQKNSCGDFLFTSDPDRCCDFNKIQPLDRVMTQFDVWISGVRKDQTAFRAGMQEEEYGKYGIKKFHPMLDWTLDDIENYIIMFSLPRHPLAKSAASSVGCEPCTVCWITAVLFRPADLPDGRV